MGGLREPGRIEETQKVDSKELWSVLRLQSDGSFSVPGPQLPEEPPAHGSALGFSWQALQSSVSQKGIQKKTLIPDL